MKLVYNESRIAPEQKREHLFGGRSPSPHVGPQPTHRTAGAASHRPILKVCHGSMGLFPPSAADFLIVPDEMCRREELRRGRRSGPRVFFLLKALWVREGTKHAA